MILQMPEFDPQIAEEFGYAVTGGKSFLGVPLMDGTNLLNLIIRFAFNLLVSWVIVKLLYYRKSGRKEYCLTFLAFSAAMFLLIFLLDSVKLQIGLTLGLFAIFGVIRYRTETVPVREMTYLFVIITEAVINGLALNISYAELALANLMIVGMLALLECRENKKEELSTKVVLYDRIENIVPERRAELIADLEKRLGLKVEDLQIGSVDFLKDSAWIKVTYRLAKGESNDIDGFTREKDFNRN